ncbi:casein kinase II, regulatory subunit [Mycena olivaceomarginata]|nr:casein kinase II, regulatory subunit [Mycena olivaceomarginata]
MASDSDYGSTVTALSNVRWISWFLSSKGNEYFCEVDEDFVLDRFNLTGLNTEVESYAQALDLITDQIYAGVLDEQRGLLHVQARVLYGLIHARWIVTTRGLARMVKKYNRGDFGRCPRVLCESQSLLPVGLVDLSCGRCEDLYSPKSSRHGSIDGAYFGTTFPHLLYLVYPELLSPKTGPLTDRPVSVRASESQVSEPPDEDMQSIGNGISTASAALGVERYRPRIYGFRVNETAKLQRWQEATRDRQVAKLEELEQTDEEYWECQGL